MVNYMVIRVQIVHHWSSIKLVISIQSVVFLITERPSHTNQCRAAGRREPSVGAGLPSSAHSIKAKGGGADIGAEHTILFSDIFARGYLFSDMGILFSDIMLDNL